jgi:predicted DsbA family dithiol-disulfide isomerase
MAESVSNNTGKKLVRIDVSSDTVCPWCFVGKRNLDKAIAASKDRFDFEVPFCRSLCLSFLRWSFSLT